MSQVYKNKKSGKTKGILYKNLGTYNNTVNGKTFIPKTSGGRTVYVVKRDIDDENKE